MQAVHGAALQLQGVLTVASRTRSSGFLGGLGQFIIAVVFFVALLIVELVAAMFAYGYLQLVHTDFFGWLVRQASGVLELASHYIDLLFPDQANQIYATTFGELGPKSILLLLVGLVVGAFLRVFVWSIGHLLRRT